MKKTFTINLAGMVFHIEEDAYEKLKHYLDSIKSHFSRLQEDSAEIMEDIEARTAEQFDAKISAAKQVITMEDVDELIKILGQVHDIAGEEKSKNEDGAKGYRKLFRDPNDMIIGGVCSGLAAFLNVEPLLIRLLFIVSIFFGGAGIVIYLILWLLMPEAKTPTEQMEMRGYAVTLSRIEQVVKEKLIFSPEQESRLKRLLLLPFRLLGRLLNLTGRFLRKLIPLVSVLLGLAIFAGALAAIAGLCFIFGGLTLNTFSTYVDFPVREMITDDFYYLGLVSAFLAGFIPALALFISGISLIRRKTSFNLASVLVLLTIWVMALAGIGAVAFRLIPAYEARQQEMAQMPQTSKDLNLKDFSKIDAQNWYDISIVKGDIFKVSATGTEPELNRLDARVENGVLKISRTEGPQICILCPEQEQAVRIEITMPSLSEISGRNRTSFQVSGFNEKEFVAELNGANQLNIEDSKFTNINLFLNLTSQATLKGSTENLTAELSGTARLEALEFSAKNVDLYCFDVANAKVWAQEKLTLSGDGYGRIYYKGNPTIQRINEEQRVQKMILDPDSPEVKIRLQPELPQRTQVFQFQ